MWESEGQSHSGIGSFDSERQESLKTDGFERRGQSWYVSSDIPSDLSVKVGEFTFHLHKYPLLARSGKMNRIIYESSSSSFSTRDTEPRIIDLDDLPGGPDSFELAAKFCYGVAVDLTAANISGLRCAAEYLEMTEDLEEGNLIFKTEAFLSYVVLSSWRDSIVVLKSCENLSPWAENLQIVRRCSESIAWKACANPRSIRWAYTGRSNSPKWTNSGSKESSPSRTALVPQDWWFEDVALLRIDHFVRVVTAIKVKGMRIELIGAAIVHYASKWLPGVTKESDESWSPQAGLHMIVSGNMSKDDLTSSQIKEQRMVTESLISIIPPQKDSVSCSFLLKLLKLANMLKVAPALVTELEKRVGMQLEQAALGDLLIPCYNKGETLYDVDLVQRLVEHFLVQEQTEGSSPGRGEGYGGEKHGHGYGEGRAGAGGGGGAGAKMRVARLIDSYLTEVSRDRSLSLTKFQVLAEALPESARSCDDGLYRAVDSYLKAHPTLTEHERKRLCRVMDCQKLSIDACMHAAQNERLPLRVVVQVLFSEQVKISNTIANSSLKDPPADYQHHHHHYQPMVPTRKQLLEGTPQSFQEGWATAKKDINTLKFELESVKAKYLELQNEMDVLQRQFDKMAPSTKTNSKQGSSSAWSSGWKKLSRLATKTGGAEGNEVGERGAGIGEPARRPRRWRNSIS